MKWGKILLITISLQELHIETKKVSKKVRHTKDRHRYYEIWRVSNHNISKEYKYNNKILTECEKVPKECVLLRNLSEYVNCTLFPYRNSDFDRQNRLKAYFR